MRAAVEDVHHGRGQDAGVDTAKVAVERQFEREAEARAEAMETARMALAPSLDLFAVPSMAIMVASMQALVDGVHALELGSEDGSQRFDGVQHALADVVGLVAIAEFDGFVLAGGCARRAQRRGPWLRRRGLRRLQR